MSTRIDVRSFALRYLLNAFWHIKTKAAGDDDLPQKGYPTFNVQVPSSGFCPALIAHAWPYASDVHTEMYLFRWGIARRKALSRGVAQVVPARSRDVADSGYFSLIVPCPVDGWPSKYGYGCLLSCADWCCETEAEAIRLMEEMKAPGGLMQGHSMQVLALSTLRKFEDRTL